MDIFLKPIHWISSALSDLKDCSDDIKDEVGYALHLAQEGETYHQAKPLKGYRSANVLEIISRDEQGTYRVIYTVKFSLVIYVLHVFQKKSKKGIGTPKNEIDLINSRLKLAHEHYEQYYERQK